METEYEGIWGIIVTGFNHGYRSPITAFIVGHKDLVLSEQEVGFDINTNSEPKIPILKPIDKTLEELVEFYQPRQGGTDLEVVQDNFDVLHWQGYAYIMKNWTSDKLGKPPIMIVTGTRFVDPNIWEEISTTSFIQEINDRTNVIGENK